jgi:DNA-directed RNA polymerase subunit N (RpoN/RPB10)
MAIVILGKTRCALCGDLLLEGEDVVSFPPLFCNQRDPAWVLNDAGVHRSCLVEQDLSDRALGKLREFDEHRDRPKTCAVCGRPITDPDDYFSTGPLGDGPRDPLQAFSWIEAHLSHLPRWERTPELIRVLEETSRSPEWEGEVLERLLAMVRSAEEPVD